MGVTEGEVAGSRGVGLQGPRDQLKEFGFFSGFNKFTGGLGKGFTGSQKDHHGCFVRKVCKRNTR